MVRLLNRLKSLLIKMVLSRRDIESKKMDRKLETNKGDLNRKPSGHLSVSNTAN